MSVEIPSPLPDSVTEDAIHRWLVKGEGSPWECWVRAVLAYHLRRAIVELLAREALQ